MGESGGQETPGQVKRRPGSRLAMSRVLLMAACAAVGGMCWMSGTCGAVWSLLAGLPGDAASAGYDASLPASSCVDARAVGAEQRGPFSDDGLASSWFPSLSSFVLQVGLFAGLACGSWLFIVLRGPAAPPLPLNLDRPQHELVARACPQVEQSALSATAPDEAVPAALSCGADIAFAARRHISLSAGQSPVDADSKAGAKKKKRTNGR